VQIRGSRLKNSRSGNATAGGREIPPLPQKAAPPTAPKASGSGAIDLAARFLHDAAFFQSNPAAHMLQEANLVLEAWNCSNGAIFGRDYFRRRPKLPPLPQKRHQEGQAKRMLLPR
jgi:hypothetical protein